MTAKHSLAAALLMPLLANAVAAQTPRQQALLLALGANGKQTASYQWKQKITVIRKGTPAAAILEELRFDETGQLRRLTLSQPAEKRMGPLRAKKAAEIKDSVQEVMQWAGRYASPAQLGQAIRKGEIWEGSGTLRVQARGLLLPIDEVALLVDGATYLPTRLDVKTQQEGSPVTMAMNYRQVPGGPRMMTQMTVQIPGEGIVVNVESFDFVRLARHIVP